MCAKKRPRPPLTPDQQLLAAEYVGKAIGYTMKRWPTLRSRLGDDELRGHVGLIVVLIAGGYRPDQGEFGRVLFGTLKFRLATLWKKLNARRPTVLMSELSGPDDDHAPDFPAPHADPAVACERAEADAETVAAVDQLLAQLPDAARVVVECRSGIRFGSPLSIEDTGAALGIPPALARRIERLAVARLRGAVS